MKILVINSGSSSIKYQLFATPGGGVIGAGAVERIGEAEGLHRYRTSNDEDDVDHCCVADHRAGLVQIFQILQQAGMVDDLSELSAIGHRVVHGGEYFHAPALVDQEVMDRIRDMIPLAPLHNPANLMGIEVAMQHAAAIPQVAVFDTAFHQTLPPHAFHYAIPERFYSELRVRRYGFHGTSHFYVAKQAASTLGRPLETLNLITLHLGNGASAAAIQQGRCVDTSMGMTPLEGLIMGTRCGDIDPAIQFYLNRVTGLGCEQLESVLNRESGLKGICGTNDMREVHRLADAGDERAQLALQMVSHRLKKYIGAYVAVLGHVDAIVFTGGIGENDAWIRARACAGLDGFGIAVDPHRNAAGGPGVFAVQQQDAPVSVLVVPTDEEYEIAAQTMACLQENRN